MYFLGTWQTRGHTSLMGAGIIIEARTGLVLDYYIMCNRCTTCTRMGNFKSKNKISEAKYQQWKEKHTDVCYTNYDKSSGSMEAEAALIMWKRCID